MLDIRQATLNDLGLIVEWTAKVHQQEDDGSLAMQEDFNNKLHNWLNIELDSGNNLFLIAEISGQPAGFIFGSTAINDNGFTKLLMKGIIRVLWVEEQYRKQGIAQQLVKEVTACFHENDIQYIECSYTKKNTLAKIFWERLEFKAYSVNARKFI